MLHHTKQLWCNILLLFPLGFTFNLSYVNTTTRIWILPAELTLNMHILFRSCVGYTSLQSRPVPAVRWRGTLVSFRKGSPQAKNCLDQSGSSRVRTRYECRDRGRQFFGWGKATYLSCQSPTQVTFLKHILKTAANRRPDLRFVLKAIIKALISRSSRSTILKTPNHLHPIHNFQPD